MPFHLRKALVRFTLSNPYERYLSHSHRREIIFIHIPKTAGSSIVSLLNFSIGHIPAVRFWAYDKRKFEEAWKVAFVRNPWDRMASVFKYMKHIGTKAGSENAEWSAENIVHFENFETFVLSLKKKSFRNKILNFQLTRPQLDWIRIPGHSNHSMDFLGRFETLKEDINLLSETLNVSPNIEHKRKSPGHIITAYTPEMTGIVGDLYYEDIKKLGYINQCP